MSKSSGARQDFKQDSVKQPPTGKPLPPRSSLSKQVTLEEQSGPTCVPQVHDQLAVGKPDNLEPGVVRRMADSPQPPWKFWLRVGSAAVGVGVGWLMFPVWSVSTCFLSSNLTLIPGV